MNRKYFLLVIFAALAMAAAAPARALEIIIDSSGKMTFYNDGVLGDTSDEDIQEEKQMLEMKTDALNEKHRLELRQQKQPQVEETKKRQQMEKQFLQKEADTLKNKEVNASARLRKENALKVVGPQEQRELRLKQEKAGVTVEVREKGEEELEELDEAVPERLRIELPAAPQGLEGMERAGQGSTSAQLRRAERKERIGEMIEIKKAERGDVESIEIESRKIKAKVNKSAEITIDPETNEVSLVKPSGEVATLSHLPDQAIEQLLAQGVIDPENEDGASTNMELVTKEDGSVVYVMTVPKKYKFLGLVNRKVDTEIEFNDETGESTEIKKQQTGFRGWLDSLSF